MVQHPCASCRYESVRRIDAYNAWFCDRCNSYVELPPGLSPQQAAALLPPLGGMVAQQAFSPYQVAMPAGPGLSDAACVDCRQPLTYIQQYNAWYCYMCKKYQDPNARPAAATYAQGSLGTYDGYSDPAVVATKQLIDSAEESINAASSVGVKVGAADEQLALAREQLSHGDSPGAQATAMAAKRSADTQVGLFHQVNDMIPRMEDTMDYLAQFQVHLEPVENQLQLARTFKRNGQYEKALEFLQRGKGMLDAEEAKVGGAARRAESEVGMGSTIETTSRGTPTVDIDAASSMFSASVNACRKCGNVLSDDMTDVCPYCSSPLPPKKKKASAAAASGDDDATLPADETSSLFTATLDACPECGNIVQDKQATSCQYCGFALRAAPAPAPAATAPAAAAAAPPTSPAPPAARAAPSGPVICPECNEEVEADWTRCPFCNFELSGGGAVPRPSPAPTRAATPPSAPAPVVAAAPRPSPAPSPPAAIAPAPVAVPVAAAPSPPKQPVAPPAPPIAAAPVRAAAGGVSCPACGAELEVGFKRCPDCLSQVQWSGATPSVAGAPPAALPAAAAPVAAAPPPQSVPQPPIEVPSVSGGGDAADPTLANIGIVITQLDSQLTRLEGEGQNLSHARNLVRLAQSFLAAGNAEKADRYVKKAEKALEQHP